MTMFFRRKAACVLACHAGPVTLVLETLVMRELVVAWRFASLVISVARISLRVTMVFRHKIADVEEFDTCF